MLKVKYNDVSRECAELRETVKRNLAEKKASAKIIVELNQQLGNTEINRRAVKAAASHGRGGLDNGHHPNLWTSCEPLRSSSQKIVHWV